MNSVLRLIFVITILISALNGCVASNQKNVNIMAPQTSYWHVNHGNRAQIIAQQPERQFLYSVNNLSALDPKQLIGLSKKGIQKIFGAPDFKRYDFLVEIWQYRKKNCLMDIYLYPDKQKINGFRVKHAKARSRTIYQISQKQCFLEVLQIIG